MHTASNAATEGGATGSALATTAGGGESTPDIRLENVTKAYPGAETQAVAELSLDIRHGEFFSLLGPSGSGKTTTLRMIAGFERPTTGRVLLGGIDVTSVPPFRRDVNTVFQNYALFPHMTVARNVGYPLKMAKTGKEEMNRRVREALELVDMTGYEGRLPHQLSGGERQRVALARALVSRPRVLLLDEPLGALDLKLREQMQIVLKQLQREVNISFVYVTHDQGEALAMSDRLAVMRAGRIEQIGEPADVYYEPATRFVASFIGKSNLLPCEVVQRGDRWVAIHNGLRLELPGDQEPGPATAAIRYEAISISPSGAAASDSPIPASVEDVIFLGEGQEIIAKTGEVRLVLLAPTERRERFERGDLVDLVIDGADVEILYD